MERWPSPVPDTAGPVSTVWPAGCRRHRSRGVCDVTQRAVITIHAQRTYHTAPRGMRRLDCRQGCRYCVKDRRTEGAENEITLGEVRCKDDNSDRPSEYNMWEYRYPYLSQTEDVIVRCTDIEKIVNKK